MYVICKLSKTQWQWRTYIGFRKLTVMLEFYKYQSKI